MKKSRKKKKRRTGLHLTALFVMVICAVVFFNRVKLVKQEQVTAAEYEAIKVEYEKEQEREKDLDELKVYTKTKKFVEDIARDKFGLVYNNEILFEADGGE